MRLDAGLMTSLGIRRLRFFLFANFLTVRRFLVEKIDIRKPEGTAHEFDAVEWREPGE
jgi:hypothetical protein